MNKLFKIVVFNSIVIFSCFGMSHTDHEIVKGQALRHRPNKKLKIKRVKTKTVRPVAHGKPVVPQSKSTPPSVAKTDTQLTSETHPAASDAPATDSTVHGEQDTHLTSATQPAAPPSVDSTDAKEKQDTKQQQPASTENEGCREDSDCHEDKYCLNGKCSYFEAITGPPAVRPEYEQQCRIDSDCPSIACFVDPCPGSTCQNGVCVGAPQITDSDTPWF